MRDLSFLRIPRAEGSTILSFILILSVFILFFILIGLLKEYLKKANIKRSFFKEALERGLTEEEAQILWEYALKLGRDPFLTLEFKAPFEKVVDLFLKENPQADESLIQDMRMKLGFDYLPPFVPLVSTKDIELFQPAKLYIPDKGNYEIALFDKDEKYMYWAVIDKKQPPNLEGSKVTISFIRKGDGIYKFESVVEKVFFESGRMILQVPHTFELTRYQRREYARVEVEIPVDVGIYNKEEDKIEWIKGEIVDISAGGAKVCISYQDYPQELKPYSEITLKFTLKEREFKLKATILNIYKRRSSTCYGVKYEDIKPDQQKLIHDFVREEQKKIAQLALKNRG